MEPHNLLILSDLHLGCDLKPDAPLGDARMSSLGHTLARFLDHHAARREQGQPWRLLLAGDIFDFVAITAMPAPLLTTPFAIGAEERLFGLAPEEEKCVWKVRRVAARHEDVFHALARFLVAGHEVHFIRGNHDAELQFPAVQAELSRLLVRRAGVEGATLRALAGRIQFHAWFYLEPGRIYVEHGNAHDRYCLQSGFFDESPCSSGELELPISSKVLRYFADRWARDQDDLDGADRLGAFGYIAWIFRMGSPVRIALDYFKMVARVLHPIARDRLQRGQARSSNIGLSRRPNENERLDRVRRWLSPFHAASTSPAARALCDAQARRIFSLASRPAEQSLFASAQLFYVDRMLLILATCAALLGSLLLAQRLGQALGCAFAIALFVLGNGWLARRRACDAHVLLKKAAAHIAPIFGVRTLVMGHSHQRVDERIGDARYFNLGAWHPGSGGLPYLARIGEEAELRSFAGARPSPKTSTARTSAAGSRSAFAG